VLLAAAVSWAVAMLSKAVATVVRVERLSRRPHSQRVTVIPSQHVDAYAVGGITGGQIVVTTAMLAELSEGEFGIMLEHENAHLRLRHHLFKTTVRLAVCLNPLLRPAAAAVEESAERWADECAARKVGDRRLVAQAVARAALAAHGRTPGASAVSRFGTSAVLMRVDSLLNPRSARRGSVAVAAAALVVAASLGSTALASMHTERVFEHAQHTYTATQ
jgi:beta-lactamase regulating signal transducer with metallopeptidase domain